MSSRIRMFIALVRPSALLILALFACTGVAEGSGTAGVAGVATLGRVTVAVVAFLVCSVVMNDLADARIDRVNLAGDASRLWAAGRCTRQAMAVAGFTAGAMTLISAATLGAAPFAVAACGLALSSAYSLPPLQVARRGAAASLLLPACFVAVPYLLGVLAVGSGVQARDVVLLGGLYVGFIGRILLKDFRDLRGDLLFGKRTFLVRHGRRATCAASATCWVAGLSMLLGVRALRPALVVAECLCAGVALILLRQLADDRGARRDERLISAIAIAGRGMVLLLIAHLSMTSAGIPAAAYLGIITALAVLTVGPVWTMLGRGPRMRTTVPVGWVDRLTREPSPTPAKRA